MSDPRIFDPNAPAAADAGLFGLPFETEDAKLVIVPVPWEATTSYGGGTSGGPEAVLEASHQVDLFDLDVDRPYAPGIAMDAAHGKFAVWNEAAKVAAARVLEDPLSKSEKAEADRALVNRLSASVNDLVQKETDRLLAQGKIVGILGGDHSVPLGAIAALGAKHSAFGILHIDAHSDTRMAYEGFEFSHASIMWNVMERVPSVTRLVQVGIRDVCEAEVAYVEKLGERACVFYDRDLARARHRGEPWAKTAADIVSKLPERVWISFDIDGLDPRFCPHTGTPVPGGLDYADMVALLREVVSSGRTIIGFDLSEVAPNLADPNDEWDANVGARVLYKLCALTLASQGLCKLRE